jgi:hypothetical protein
LWRPLVLDHIIPRLGQLDELIQGGAELSAVPAFITEQGPPLGRVVQRALQREAGGLLIAVGNVAAM